MHIMSTASFAESETTRVFETARTFHPALVCFHITLVFLLRLVRRLRMRSLLRPSTPPVASLPVRDTLEALAISGSYVSQMRIKVNSQDFCPSRDNICRREESL